MDLPTECIKSLPIWIQLPDLDIKFWGTGSLSKLESCLGIPLKTDKYTKDRTMLKYARLLIDISLEGPFPEYIEFFDEVGVLIRQQVIYEWKPLQCTHCHMFGHEDNNCRRKKELRTEWRPVTRVNPGAVSTVQTEIPTEQLTSIEQDVFIPVSIRDVAKHPRQVDGPSNHETGNPFQALDTAGKGDLQSRGEGILSHG